MKRLVFKWVRLLTTGMLLFTAGVISGCFDDGTSIFDNPAQFPTVVTTASSTGSGSGAIAIFTVNGVAHVLVPGGPLNPTAVKLLTLPNTGPIAGGCDSSDIDSD